MTKIDGIHNKYYRIEYHTLDDKPAVSILERFLRGLNWLLNHSPLWVITD